MAWSRPRHSRKAAYCSHPAASTASIAIGQDMITAYNGPVGDLLEFQIYESLALLVRAPESILVLK